MCAPEKALEELSSRIRNPIEILLSVLMKRKSNWDTDPVRVETPGRVKKIIRDHKHTKGVQKL